jgi:uncharacterized protein YlxW (UPF0749 family)
MVMTIIVGTILSALLPLLFLPILRRMDAQRLSEEQRDMQTELEKLQREASHLESHLADVRRVAERTSLFEEAR